MSQKIKICVVSLFIAQNEDPLLHYLLPLHLLKCFSEYP